MKNFLSRVELIALMQSLPPVVRVDRVRPHNRGEIRKTVEMPAAELSALVLNSFDEGHQPGGDLEVIVGHERLVGHHDGVYWLEPVNTP